MQREKGAHNHEAFAKLRTMSSQTSVLISGKVKKVNKMSE